MREAPLRAKRAAFTGAFVGVGRASSAVLAVRWGGWEGYGLRPGPSAVRLTRFKSSGPIYGREAGRL